MSALGFFLTFGSIIISFCFVFHTLLPASDSFNRLDNSFVKVLAMLMGELDFTNSFVKNEEAGLAAKLFFLIFLVFMALVFMNLLLGIAVSDIHELERVSQSHAAIINSWLFTCISNSIARARTEAPLRLTASSGVTHPWPGGSRQQARGRGGRAAPTA